MRVDRLVSTNRSNRELKTNYFEMYGPTFGGTRIRKKESLLKTPVSRAADGKKSAGNACSLLFDETGCIARRDFVSESQNSVSSGA